MRVSKMTVYRLVHAGELPAVRVGRSFRVPEQAVHDYLATPTSRPPERSHGRTTGQPAWRPAGDGYRRTAEADVVRQVAVCGAGQLRGTSFGSRSSALGRGLSTRVRLVATVRNDR